jgi:hypothetical protein
VYLCTLIANCYNITYDKTNDYYQQLSQEFTTQDVMTVWGYTSKATASTRIKGFIDSGAVKKLQKGRFKKLATAI